MDDEFDERKEVDFADFLGKDLNCVNFSSKSVYIDAQSFEGPFKFGVPDQGHRC